MIQTSINNLQTSKLSVDCALVVKLNIHECTPVNTSVLESKNAKDVHVHKS